jgi:plasmid stabilization system protein ParE
VAFLITWSKEARKTFDDNIDYLLKEWTEREARNFINNANQKIQSIVSNPKLYRRSEKNAHIRRATINKHIILYYRYFPIKKEVILLTFWNTSQNPRRKKY